MRQFIGGRGCGKRLLRECFDYAADVSGDNSSGIPVDRTRIINLFSKIKTYGWTVEKSVDYLFGIDDVWGDVWLLKCRDAVIISKILGAVEATQ